jgi:Zn-dependent M16 (insulinase) family peptidase
MKKSLIENPHRLDLTVNEIKHFQEKVNAEINAELDKRKQKLTDSEKQSLIEKSRRFNEEMNVSSPLHLLPVLKVSDVDPIQRSVNYTVSYDIFEFPRVTNGLVYIRIKSELPITGEEIRDISLFKTVLTSLGAGNLNDVEFAEQVALKTDGITARLIIRTDMNGEPKVSIVICGMALAENFQNLIDLMASLIEKPHLDNEKQIASVLSIALARESNAIPGSGLEYAGTFSHARYDSASALSELLTGVTAFQRLREIVQSQNWTFVSQKLIEVYTNIFRKGKFSADVHGPQQDLFNLTRLIARWNHREFQKSNLTFLDVFKKSVQSKQFLKVDGSTFFSTLSIKTDIHSEAHTVAAALLKSEFLEAVVREKLGAYGVSVRYGWKRGIFTFGSYRDSNPIKVLEAFNQSLTMAGEITEEMVERTIVRKASHMDHPTPPGYDGIGCFVDEESCKRKQERRTALLNVSKNDIIEAIQKLLTNGNVNVVVLGGTELPGFEVIDLR